MAPQTTRVLDAITAMRRHLGELKATEQQLDNPTARQAIGYIRKKLAEALDVIDYEVTE